MKVIQGHPEILGALIASVQISENLVFCFFPIEPAPAWTKALEISQIQVYI